MPRHSDEPGSSGGFGLQECLQSATRLRDSMQVIDGPHIVDLPEVQVVDVHG